MDIKKTWNLNSKPLNLLSMCEKINLEGSLNVWMNGPLSRFKEASSQRNKRERSLKEWKGEGGRPSQSRKNLCGAVWIFGGEVSEEQKKFRNWTAQNFFISWADWTLYFHESSFKKFQDQIKIVHEIVCEILFHTWKIMQISLMRLHPWL